MKATRSHTEATKGNDTAQPVNGSSKNREDRFAKELFDALDRNGCLVNKKDMRRIKEAFERHFREVFSQVYRVPNYDLIVLEPLACLEDGPLDPDAPDATPMYDSGFPTLGQVRAAREVLKIAKLAKTV